MMSASSILLIDSDRAIGYSPGRRGRDLTVISNDTEGDLGLSIEAVLAAMPGRQRQVYVLSTDVWSQTVTVESRSLRRIDKSQVPQMLAFEAESLSGIPANAARTSIHLLETGPLETTYWLSQLDAARFSQVADAIAFNGGKLMGIAHPAGLSLPISISRGDWTRLELWQDLTVAVSRHERSTVRRQFLSEPEEPIENAAAARDFMKRAGVEPGPVVELLNGLKSVKSSVEANGEQHNLSISDEDDLRIFMQAWGRQLRHAKHIPVIVPIRQKASAQTKRLVGLAATAAVVIGVAAHHQYNSTLNESRIEELETKITELQAPVQAHASDKKRLNKIETDLNSASESLASLEKEVLIYQGEVGISRSRMAALLRTLSEQRPQDLFLSEVTANGNEIRIVGRSMDSESIVEFARSMAVKLQSLNLSIRVPRREALLVTADGGPYEFEYVVTDGA